MESTTSHDPENVTYFRRRTESTLDTQSPRAFDDFHEWLLSLPWVVERPDRSGMPGIRSFAVDCEPLARRQTWLLTGLRQEPESDGMGIAVIVPAEAAGRLERIGWRQSIAAMASRHEMVAFYGDPYARRAELEALVLTAYGHAMS